MIFRGMKRQFNTRNCIGWTTTTVYVVIWLLQLILFYIIYTIFGLKKIRTPWFVNLRGSTEAKFIYNSIKWS